MSQRTVEYDQAICVAVTDEAMLVELDDDQVWIPKSQIIQGDTEIEEKGDIGTLVITEWVALQKGLV